MRVNAVRLLATLVICFALAFGARADELIREFAIKESFGVAHPDQIIDFDFASQVDWANAYMLGPGGGEVLYQRLSDGKIAVRSDLPANATKTWKLMIGRQPSTFGGGIQIEEKEAHVEITNGKTGIRIPTPSKQGQVPPAPLQAIMFRDGTWSSSEFNELTFPRCAANDYFLSFIDPQTGSPKPRPTLSTNMTIRFLERGPLKTAVEVNYELWHDAAANPRGGELAPAGSAFYRCVIKLEAGQPSIIFEEDTDTEVYWTLDVAPGVHPDQARYRGYGSSSPELGREPDGRQYRPASSRPAIDALVNLAFDQPVALDYSGIHQRPLMVWDPGGKPNIGQYWQLYESSTGASANIAGVFAGPASRAVGAGVSGAGVVTSPAAITDHVSKLHSDGSLHSVYQTGETLWHVRFDSSLNPSAPVRIAQGLTNPDLVVRENGLILVAAYDRRGGKFMLVEQIDKQAFSMRPLTVLEKDTPKIEDPYPYLASTSGREFFYFFGSINGESGGILLSRESGTDPFSYQGTITDRFKLFSESKRPVFTALSDGRVILIYQDASGLVAQATILQGATTFGAPGDGRLDPRTGVGGFYNLGSGVDPVAGHIFVGDQTDELWHLGAIGAWTATKLPLRGEYTAQGPNRRTLATAPNGDALAVHNKLDQLQPESQIWMRKDGVWQAFPYAPKLKLTSARVHFHVPSQQFLLLGRASGMLTLFGWRSEEAEPRLLHQLPDTQLRSAGFAVSTQRYSTDTSFFPRIRFSWGLFIGAKGEDLKDPYQTQPIAQQMNLHGGINLNKVHRWILDFPDPPHGWGGLFMDHEVLQSMIARLRNDKTGAYLNYLLRSAGEESTQSLVYMWADKTGAKNKTVANEIYGAAHSILDTFVNGDGIFEWRYHYWIGGAEMSRRGNFIDSVLADAATTVENRAKVKASAAAFASILWDDDFAPLFQGHGLSLGTANMASQQVGYRSFYALMLRNHPEMRDRVNAVTQSALNDLHSRINEYGAQISSTHYVEAWTPTLDRLLQIRQGGELDPFQQEAKLTKFAEFYMNFSTPPEPRFGGVRKLISVGDGSTESMPMFGQLATGFRSANPELSARLMGMWDAQGKPHSWFFGTTILKIDETAPRQDPTLSNANFPGWYSVLRHGWGTANETALWLIHGNDYSDHRHDDHGSTTIYALGAPLSIDWGPTYSPQVPGPFMHNIVVPESVYPLPWDMDNIPLDGYPAHWSRWKQSAQEAFVAFAASARVRARMDSDQSSHWNRTAYEIHANEDYPILVLADDFTGQDSDSPKIFTQCFTATGDVDTPSGRITPPLRSWLNYGASPKSELPSIGPLVALQPGVNRFAFTGQWLIDWEVYTVADQPRQARIGNWGHDWHPSLEAGQFRDANKRPFEERQHILRIKGNGGFKTLILPYRKGQRPEGLAVTQEGVNLLVNSTGDQTTIGPDWFAFRSAKKSILTSFGASSAAAFGWELSGGPTEVAVTGGKLVVTPSGAPGLRRLRIPGNWIPEAPLVKVGDEFQLNWINAGPVSAVAYVPNHAPELAPVQDQTISEGLTFNLQVEAVDLEGPAQTLAFALPVAPVGMTIDSVTGVLTWTPSEAQGPGQYAVTVRATDSGEAPLSAHLSFVIKVVETNVAPVLSAIAAQTASEGMLFTITPSASDADLPASKLTWSIGIGAPSGMKIDEATGLISWTPDEAQGGQSFPVTVKVTDGGVPPLSAYQTFTINVAEVNAAPKLADIPNAEMDEGRELTFTATATDTDLPAQKLNFSLAPPVVQNTLIDPLTGIFTFTPSEGQGPGVYTFTIRVYDDAAERLVDRQLFIVTVREVNSAPNLSVISNQSAEAGRELAFSATAVDADFPANAIAFALGAGAPDGAKITSSGEFTWTPTESQGGASYPVTIVATDDGQPPLMDSKAFQVTVAAVQREIRLTEAKVSADRRFSLSWTAEPGRSYQVQSKESVTDTAWSEVQPPIMATAAIATFTAPVSEAEHRFYRVARLP